MLAQLLPLLILQNSSAVTASDRITAPPAVSAPTQMIGVRVSSPQGVLWQGTLRIAENQSASYSQNLSQASTLVCPPGSPYDRSERTSVSFNVYAQNYGQGRPNYRLDASWARPIVDADCGESGTRTVQINQSVTLDPGQTATIEGDAGLRVELSRPR
jgi:archaellum component FlaG (FlaF/FlaG flagellin family)